MSRIITIITTGGTIDGADSDKGTQRLTSDAAKWLAEQSNNKVHHIPLLNKDSRLITSEDRRKILDAIAAVPSNLILLTHGTFTICETGRVIKKAQAKNFPLKRVLLVGAWKPFGEPNSDALSQMQFALKQFGDESAGVFVAMDGRLWDPYFTEKVEISSGIFELKKMNHMA